MAISGWVNRTNVLPTRGQAGAYTLFNYNSTGQVSRRKRRYDDGSRQTLDLLWDGDDRLRTVNDHATSALFFSALYDGDGTRVKKTDKRAGVLTVNDYSYRPQTV